MNQDAQTDILEALDYQVNLITPNAIFDELRLSLSSLRHLVPLGVVWDTACDNAWYLLKQASIGLFLSGPTHFF